VFSTYRAMIGYVVLNRPFILRRFSSVLEVSRRVFAIARQGGGQTLLALTNIAPDDVSIDIGAVVAGPSRDLISKKAFSSKVL
jgi:hypothetical protein